MSDIPDLELSTRPAILGLGDSRAHSLRGYGTYPARRCALLAQCQPRLLPRVESGAARGRVEQGRLCRCGLRSAVPGRANDDLTSAGSGPPGAFDDLTSAGSGPPGAFLSRNSRGKRFGVADGEGTSSNARHAGDRARATRASVRRGSGVGLGAWGPPRRRREATSGLDSWAGSAEPRRDSRRDPVELGRSVERRIAAGVWGMG